MIRKFSRLAHPPEAVRAVFGQLEAWPEWMPGVRSLRVTGRAAGTMTLELEQVQMNRRLRQTVVARLDDRSVEVHQVRGPLRRWRTRWGFAPSPEGEGTTLVMELELEVGGMAFMVPHRLILEAVDDAFRRTVAAAAARLGHGSTPATTSEGAAADVLAAVARGEEVVLEVAGRRFRLEAI